MYYGEWMLGDEWGKVCDFFHFIQIQHTVLYKSSMLWQWQWQSGLRSWCGRFKSYISLYEGSYLSHIWHRGNAGGRCVWCWAVWPASRRWLRSAPTLWPRSGTTAAQTAASWQNRGRRELSPSLCLCCSDTERVSSKDSQMISANHSLTSPKTRKYMSACVIGRSTCTCALAARRKRGYNIW